MEKVFVKVFGGIVVVLCVFILVLSIKNECKIEAVFDTIVETVECKTYACKKDSSVSKDTVLSENDKIKEEPDESFKKKGTMPVREIRYKNIVDRARGYCYAPSAIEEFYRDDRYIYSFSSEISYRLEVVYEDGTKEDFTQALNSGHITIYNLDEVGLYYDKEPIV